MLPGEIASIGRDYYVQQGVLIFFISFFWVILAGWIAGVGRRRKGLSWGGLFWLGFGSSAVLSGAITVAMPEVYHPDETVECPSCSTRLRFLANTCHGCGQKLTPNLPIGQDTVNRAAAWNARLKWLPLLVTVLGALAVTLLLIQSDENFAKTAYLVPIAFALLGIGAALWAVMHMRRKLVNDLYAELVRTV